MPGKSADTGAETTPEHVEGPDGRIVPILCGRLSSASRQTWRTRSGNTGRRPETNSFCSTPGAEILLETGRFWSSRAQPEADGYCHIRHVIGPDEYHEDIDDNAFMNVMARSNIRRALEIAALLCKRWPDKWADFVIPPWVERTGTHSMAERGRHDGNWLEP